MTEQIKQRQPLIELKDVTKTYHDGKRKDVFAVSNFNLTLYEGETLGLVGESGCGKSTVGNMLVHLLTPDEGSILFRGQDITSMNERQFHPLRKEIQMVFQDPYSSLNPRKKIGWLLEEPLKIHRKNMKKRRTKGKGRGNIKRSWPRCRICKSLSKGIVWWSKTARQHCPCIFDESGISCRR